MKTLNGKPYTRRDLLAGAAAAAAGSCLAGAAAAADKPVTIGSGHWTYTLEPGWGAAPDGMEYAWGCAIVADSKDCIYVHSRAPRAVVVFDREGRLVNDFGAEFAGTGHGLYHSREGGDEFLYFSDHPRNQVVKTDLTGKVVMRIGKGLESHPNHIEFAFNQPTDVAVAPNGDIWVCEGYGANLVHQFTRDGKFVRTVGTPGSGPGQFKTCHGVWVDTRRDEPEIYIADRNNGRTQVFSTDGRLLRILYDGMRNPCCFYEHRGKMFIPDLKQVVTILDETDRPIALLGDGLEIQGAAAFVKPHALTLDSRGDLYVVEWVQNARMQKFRHTPRKA